MKYIKKAMPIEAFQYKGDFTIPIWANKADPKEYNPFYDKESVSNE